MTFLPSLSAGLLLRLTLSALVLGLAGCADDGVFRQDEKLLAEARTEAGLAALEAKAAAHPGEARFRAALLRAREDFLRRGLAQAEARVREGDDVGAADQCRAVQARFPDDPRVTGLLGEIQMRLDHQARIKTAQTALARKEPEQARAALRAVLAQAPGHEQARRLLLQVEAAQGSSAGERPQLGTAARRPVTLEFRDAPMKLAFDALSRQAGINFVFDKDLRQDQRVTVYAREAPLADALDALLATAGLAKKVLGANAALIYPNQPNKSREYQEQVVKSFFLAHADAKAVMSLIRSMARIKDVYVDEKLNMVAVRDTPEAVRLAEKLVRMNDRPDAEAMLDVEILEVKRSRLQELGVQWPTQLTALNLGTQTTTTVGTGVSVTTGAQVTNQLTLDSLRRLNAGAIGITAASIQVKKDSSDVNILANPRIRVKSREKARIHIGDKVPVITTNTTSTGVVSESVSYLDVGLKLDVEPRIGLEGDVGIQVSLEVSNIVKEIKSASGALTYQLGSRNASTALRLRDGETQVLAGLISDEDRAGATKLPGLGDLPVLGRLFSSQRDELSKTEIVLTITPRILRNVERPELADAEFYAGTEAQSGDQPLQMRGPAAPAAEPPPPPQAVVAPAPAPEATPAP